jgi:integrase
MARRAKGEGSVGPYKGKWRVRISVRGVRKAWILPTKQEAARKLREVIKELERGNTVEQMRAQSHRLTVGAYLEEWLLLIAGRVPRTHVDYHYALQPIIKEFGPVRLVELSPRMIAGYFATHPVRHSWKTHLVLRFALKQAVTQGLLARNPTDGFKGPKRPPSNNDVLTPDEVAAVLKECEKDIVIGALVTTALLTGMRLGELRALTWRDIDFKTGLVSVTKGATWEKRVKGAGQWLVGPPKTESSRRTIQAGPALLQRLERHRTQLRASEMAAHITWPHPELVFPSPRGDYFADPRKRVDDLMSRAKVQRVRFHDLRHTAATLMLLRGVAPRLVSKTLGHANIGITLGLYAHVLDEMRDTAAHAMDSLLTNPKENHYAGGTPRDSVGRHGTSRDGREQTVRQEGLTGW